MKLYIPAPAARAMSDALWSLSRPIAVRGPSDTQYLFPWTKAINDSRWLMVDTTYEVNVHPQAVAAAIVSVLRVYEDEEALPLGTLAALALRVEALRGSRVVIYEEFPQFFKDASKTREEMIAAGLLSEPGGEV